MTKAITPGTKIYLATYGSLKEGFYNHARFLGKDKKPIGYSSIKGYMFMASGYPYLFKEAPNDKAILAEHTLEFYEITKEQEEIIDMIEAPEYDKTLIWGKINGKPEKTIIYWTKPSQAHRAANLTPITNYSAETLKEFGYLN